MTSKQWVKNLKKEEAILEPSLISAWSLLIKRKISIHKGWTSFYETFWCLNLNLSIIKLYDLFYFKTWIRTQEVWLKGMVDMNNMLVPIDVFVDLEYDKHPETTHTS